MTTVAAFGDTAPPLQAGVAVAVAAVDPDAVLFLGDAVDGRREWPWSRGLTRWVRDLAPLAGRVLAVGGNHDYEPDGGMARYTAALEALGCPPDRRIRFSAELDGIHLVGITLAHRAGCVSADDLAWCEDAFRAGPRVAARVVAVHEPLFPIAGRIGISLDADPARRDAFLRHLQEWRVSAVLCGHEHLYSRRTIGPGLVQIGCGGGGAQSEKAVFGHGDCVANAPHYVTLTPLPGGLAVEARSLDGQAIDRTILPMP